MAALGGTITAAALIRDEHGRVLLVREGYGRRRFSLPGGVVGAGETPADAAVREAREETGLTVKVTAEVGVYTLTRGDGSTVQMHALACEVIVGEPRFDPNPEISEVGWFDPYHLPDPMKLSAPHPIADFIAGRSGVTRTIDISSRVTEVHQIGERRVTLPVHVRQASSWAAQFLVDARAAQGMVSPTGLGVVRPVPGKAIASIVFVRYEDTDLDAYNEVGLGFLVHAHDGKGVGVYIHQLPVNQAFTLQAGREIWGYPKFMADIAIETSAGHASCTLREDRSLVLGMSVQHGGYLILPSSAPPTYTYLDGVLRRTDWEMPGVRIRGRFGGARLALGTHPLSDELRALGLPKTAMMSQSIPKMRARFGPAREVR